MKKKNSFLTYKKVFLSIFLFFLLALSICTFLMRKRILKRNQEKQIKEFKEIVDFNEKKNVNIIQKESNFLNKNKNIYGILVGINLSKKYFIQKKYLSAIKILNKISSFSLEKNLNYLIKLNLVKIYIKNKNFSLALDIINKIQDNLWKRRFKDYKKYCFIKRDKRSDSNYCFNRSI